MHRILQKSDHYVSVIVKQCSVMMKKTKANKARTPKQKPAKLTDNRRTSQIILGETKIKIKTRAKRRT